MDVGDLENGGQASAEHVGQIIDVRLKKLAYKKSLKIKVMWFELK